MTTKDEDVSEIPIRIAVPSLVPDLKGRIVRPAKGLDDPSFKWVSAINTDLAKTFRKARERL